MVLFLGFCFTAGRWLVFSAIRWVNDNFRSDFPVITTILVITGVMAIITQLLGVRTVLGAFMAGVLIGESPILTNHIQGQLRGMITAFFMPIFFFGMSGLAADLTILKDWNLAALTALLVAIASIGKFSGAFAGAMLGRLKWREGIALGCAMNARGSTEVIVASIGLSMGALARSLHHDRHHGGHHHHGDAAHARGAARHSHEQGRRNAHYARGHRPEGLFAASRKDCCWRWMTAVGRMGARLAGLIAGAQGMPVTMLKLASDLRQATPMFPDASPAKSRIMVRWVRWSGRAKKPAKARSITPNRMSPRTPSTRRSPAPSRARKAPPT
ncbi:MAG: cation:proton antiporter [Alphaproteobacteria bacterium]